MLHKSTTKKFDAANAELKEANAELKEAQALVEQKTTEYERGQQEKSDLEDLLLAERGQKSQLKEMNAMLQEQCDEV